MTTEQKIKRYHAEEIMLILFICSTDLSEYKDDDLVNFAEDIEGRVEVLFESDYLLSLKDHFNIPQDTIEDFGALKKLLRSLYSPNWHKKMKDKVNWNEVNALSTRLLKRLNIDWVEPMKFVDTHLEIDW